MTIVRIRLAAAATLIALAAAGCGVGPGEGGGGQADLTITRDYGSTTLLETTIPDPGPSDTVIRALDREADVETRYGGGFVQSIDGIEAGRSGGRSRDWFFYVNGIESPTGAAEVELNGGDRVWWDFRDWTDAMSVPAVVGAYPEPFLHGSEGKAFPVRVDCLGESESCQSVLTRLGEDGVPANLAFDRARIGSEVIRVLVGTWDEIRVDTAAALLDGGPGESGVFAGFESSGDGFDLVGLAVDGSEAERYGAGAGLVAAVRLPDQQPAWLITGTDQAGVERAIEALDEKLLDQSYAVAAPADTRALVPLPLGAGR